MDECLTLLRALLRGEPASFAGEFLDVRDALIVPAPDPPVRITVGGRSSAAVRRAALLGDGWLGDLGLAAALRRCQRADRRAGRRRRARPGAVRARAQPLVRLRRGAEAARGPLATAMETFYGTPFGAFEKYSPYGRPEDVAAFLARYAEAGCGAVNLIPCAADPDEALAGAGAVRRLLAAE